MDPLAPLESRVAAVEEMVAAAAALQDLPSKVRLFLPLPPSLSLSKHFSAATAFQGSASVAAVEERVAALPLLPPPSKARSPNPQPSTINPQPSTLNPQPSTLNPKPESLNHKP